ncbi:hypothetical protein [Roseimicrobium sp. ORNL1]|uniref:hypothetical protein n=1 Tax=Roseimicrobium sp. ORNL1 TaxID=2711231 RepID=UPI0013E11C68|nr:hypothetical protein [Roseimicrobium sp. ORNL1]QIF05169.1 hypothetical protein G5S37_27865 [Roseimicrobium sp. ORNL1]
MSITALKAELAQLPQDQRRELVGYLISLNRPAAEEERLKSELARKIEDNDPANWMSLDDAEKLLLPEQDS